MKVALLGAAGTGKSWLAQALARHWPVHVFLDAPDIDAAVDWDRVLLMGLDWPDGASQPDAANQASRRAEDARLRAWLGTRGLSYGLVYGPGPQRLHAALQQLFPEEWSAQHRLGRWRGACETCADPACELRLFTELAASSSDATAPSSSKAADVPPG
jgi:hypothetical protein